MSNTECRMSKEGILTILLNKKTEHNDSILRNFAVHCSPQSNFRRLNRELKILKPSTLNL